MRFSKGCLLRFTLNSMKISARRRQAAEQRGKVNQSFGDQVHDFAFARCLPKDAQQARTEKFAVLFLDQLRMNDDAGQSCLSVTNTMPLAVPGR